MSVLLTMTGSAGAGTASGGGGTVMAEKVVRSRVGHDGYTRRRQPGLALSPKSRSPDVL